MSTKLIGYQIKTGTFIKSDTGEVTPYSNRLLRCITDTGANAQNIGFAGFEQKFKTADCAACLGCPNTEEDVNRALNALINAEIGFTSGVVNGAYTIVGFYPIKKGG